MGGDGGGGAAERVEGVVVAGAGPVGLVTALKLARAGLRVTVLEAGAELVRSPRAIVYHCPVLEALEEAGLLDDLRAIGVVKRDYMWRSVQGEVLCRLDMGEVLRPGDTRHPYNLHLGQHALATVILRHLLRLPGVEMRWRHAVAGVEANDEAGATLLLDTPEGPRRLRADWVVGADGARSGVRKGLGLGFEGVTWPEWFVATDIRHDFERHGWCRATFVVDPDHWAVVPIIDERAGLWRMTYREHPGTPEEEVLRLLPERQRRLLPGGEAVEPEAVSPYRVHNRCAERFRVGRVLLAGDAAHVVNPIGGLGLTGGLLDAVALGEALVAHLRGGRGEAVLDAWAEERRRVFLDVTSPAATENRRRLSEGDPARKAQDLARFARLQADPEFAREGLLFPFKLVGRSPVALAA